MARGQRTAIYTRVSTCDQKADLQLDDLKEHAARRGFEVLGVFSDECSGRARRLPEREKVMELAHKRRIDIILCWQIDRLGRSTIDLARIAAECNALGVDMIFSNQQIDTTTPMGRCFYSILGALAQMESDQISERVRSGMAAAKRRGKHVGRRPTSMLKQRRARRLRKKGMSYRQIAKEVGISPGSAYRYGHHDEKADR